MKITIKRRGDSFRVRWSDADWLHSEILKSFKATFDERRFVGGAWTLPADCDTRLLLEQWAEGWFRHAVYWEDEPARKERSTPTPLRPPSPLDQALGILWLRPGAPLWAAESVYRAALKQVHPDHGGSHAETVAANEAIAVIRESLGQRQAS